MMVIIKRVAKTVVESRAYIIASLSSFFVGSALILVGGISLEMDTLILGIGMLGTGWFAFSLYYFYGQSKTRSE